MLRKKCLVCFLAAVFFCLLMSRPAFAEEPTAGDLLRRIEQLEKRITDLTAPSDAATSGEKLSSDEAPPLVEFLEGVDVGGFIDISYGYNFNNPDTQKDGNALRVFDTDHNSFNFDLLEVYVEKEAVNPGDAGFRVDLDFGRIADLIDLDPDFGDEEDNIDVQQAYLTYKAPIGNGLDITLGKFVTWIGAEVIESKDNPNFSRSYLFGFAIPFTHTGLGLSYAFNDNVYYSQYVVNGWDNVVDNNDSKSVGGQLGATPTENLALYLSWIYGPEMDDNGGDKRGVIDLIATYQATDSLAFILNYDFGSEDNAALDGGDADWQGFAAIADYDVSDRLGFALRGEWFNDDGGSRTGADQDLYELTLTGEYHWTDDLMTRLEYRHDWSSKDSFSDDGGFDDSQDTVFFDVVYEF